MPTVPDNCDAGNVKLGREVKVELLVAVMFAAVPCVFWFNVGISKDESARNVGGCEPPVLAPANIEFWASFLKLDNVSVPDEVTGLFVMLNRFVESDNPTEVT